RLVGQEEPLQQKAGVVVYLQPWHLRLMQEDKRWELAELDIETYPKANHKYSKQNRKQNKTK
ncbi:hypothetical protein ACQP3J_32250, partial [Escherichia coli]